MRIAQLAAAALGCAALFEAGCDKQRRTSLQDVSPSARVSAAPSRIEPGEGAARRIQQALIAAELGDVIELGIGRFDCRSTLSLDVSGVTVRGQGPGKTILSFKEQRAGTGGEGLLITSREDVVVEGLAIEDAKGDAIKVQGTSWITLRNLRAEWTAGPKETNGSYGIYPVQCHVVLIEDCIAVGASDAGIYVGQSDDIVIRNCTARQNVAGIEVENSTRADVYNNLATGNTGGILVFALPDLPKKDGRHCRIFDNRVQSNNLANFAPKGNMVATVPPGTGVMIMAHDEVEVFHNTIEHNETAGVSIVSYLITDKPIQDEEYDPFCETVFIHSNQFASNGEKPAGAMGVMLAAALGTPLPDILYDGITDPKKQVDGAIPNALAFRLHNNGAATFANFDAPALKAAAAAVVGDKDAKLRKPKIIRDPKVYDGDLPALLPVVIEGLQ